MQEPVEPAEESRVEARLAACWVLLLGAATLALREHPARALYGVLWLGAAAFPVLWTVTRGDAQSVLQRAREGACGALVAAPLVALLWPWSPVSSEVLGGCALGVLSSWLAVGLWLSGGAPEEGRGVRTAWALGLAAGVPLGLRVLSESFGWERRTWASAADALRGAWSGPVEVGDWAVSWLPWLVVGGGGWLLRRRLTRRAGVALCVLAAGVAAGQDADARLVFGGWSRPGEPVPVWVRADPNAPGWPGVKVAGARSLRAPRAGALALEGPPAPSDLVRLEVGYETTGAGWKGRTLPESLRAVPTGSLLIGALGGAPPAGAFPPGPLIALLPRDVPLLARAGQALDVLWVAPGALREGWIAPLEAWASCGGTLVLGDAGEAANFGLPAQPGGRTVGAGWIVFAPTKPRGLAWSALSARLNTRARRQATVEALQGRAAPGMPASVTRWLVLVALAWVLTVLAVVRWAPRSLAALAVASLSAWTAIGWGGARYAGPRVRSAQVLEACAGSDVARRLEVLSVYGPRPSEASFDLGPGNPPYPLHRRALEAWRHPLTVRSSPEGSRVTCRTSPAGTSLARLEAVRLGGAISVTRGSAGNRLRLANQAGLDLEGVFVLFRGAAYRVGDLAQGRQVEFDLQQAAQRFDRWRLRTLSPRDASLLRAVVYGRELDRELVVVGWTRGSAASAPPEAAWVEQERTLVLVRAVGP
ncbi:MAG: hypothetical protein KDD82_20620 [Planctomycetes bacterium]|nr:hypothetical protein [Planctomycetota bacterium]